MKHTAAHIQCGSCGVVWCGVVWCGVVWCGVVWCGVVWCGVVWCGVVWCGVVWCGVVWCGAVWCGVVWCGVVWCGVVWCGVVWCGVVRCGAVWFRCAVRCGAVHLQLGAVPQRISDAVDLIGIRLQLHKRRQLAEYFIGKARQRVKRHVQHSQLRAGGDVKVQGRQFGIVQVEFVHGSKVWLLCSLSNDLLHGLQQ